MAKIEYISAEAGVVTTLTNIVAFGLTNVNGRYLLGDNDDEDFDDSSKGLSVQSGEIVTELLDTHIKVMVSAPTQIWFVKLSGGEE